MENDSIKVEVGFLKCDEMRKYTYDMRDDIIFLISPYRASKIKTWSTWFKFLVIKFTSRSIRCWHKVQSKKLKSSTENKTHSITYHRTILNKFRVSLNCGCDRKLVELLLERQTWSREVEFLLSCISMSVGLGNLWRFPAVAYSNVGGIFLIPYVIVLYIIGRPGCFLEMIVSQFSLKGTIKSYDCAPAMREVGVGQVVAFVATYYSSIMGLTMKFLYDLFSSVLPWSVCSQ